MLEPDAELDQMDQSCTEVKRRSDNSICGHVIAQGRGSALRGIDAWSHGGIAYAAHLWALQCAIHRADNYSLHLVPH